MADSPGSSNLSDPPSSESEDNSRRSIDRDGDLLAPPSKRRRTGHSSRTTYERAPSSQPADEQDDIDLSSDSEGSAPASPTHQDEYAIRDEALTQCLWRDCDFGEGVDHDDLVQHVQAAHCATNGPKKTKFVCEWGECQRKTSNHPSGYALKAHMRSHTKEKPYYCVLPECDKSFTRSDALAKHMRTVHEPEPIPPSTMGRRGIKLKITNGNNASKAVPPADHPSHPVVTHDEDGNPVEPSPITDNIKYIPAHHPITGQPGFMINYPSDINFTARESSIPADQLMRLLRRQLHWAETEAKQLQKEIADLEFQRRQEWVIKEIELDGMLESELDRGKRDGFLDRVDTRVRRAMEQDVKRARELKWTRELPPWINRSVGFAGDGADDDDVAVDRAEVAKIEESGSPSPPPTGHSGGRGFDGDEEPFDNYVNNRFAEYQERERVRSMQNTPQQKTQEEQQEAEADAVGALVGLSESHGRPSSPRT